ncbi:NADP-dependent oxidoreductase [Polaribacter sp. IC073]|uniref:NADP-dependent oxidoreductase n=1 Tax=Polaribacter sp. IC073 TaxID=2508540 RepID=UPI0011BE5D49|nr:NADP-dependent oxidoreductase [Polaribacter sp. IC073]TXD49439.1 NADP-dependent oxidoreductase [Polaribacter sp. IC073]
MKAVQFTGYGEVSKSIKVSEIEKPIINKNEVLIETYAAGVNPLDIKVIEGDLKSVSTFKLPATLGYDISGVIIEKGEHVTDFNIGDEIFSKVKKQGTFTEFVAINKNLIGLKPKNISFEEAASLPLVGLTAIQALKRGKLKSSESILIHAGSGGVGSFAIQYAKSIGAYLYTTTSTENVKWVKELGADRVIDYKTVDYRAIVKDIDMVLDTLGNEFTEDAFKVIKNKGSVITLVGPVDAETANRMKLNKIIQLFLAFKRRKITKQIKLKSAFYSLLFMRDNAKQLHEIKELVATGKIKINIDKVFPLNETLNALLYVKKGHTKGKVVLKIK